MLKQTLAALVLSTSLAACGDRAPHVIQVHTAAEAERPAQLTVNGQAVLEVSPDCADLTISIAVEAPKSGSAVKQLDAKKAAMIAALHAVGVETADVKLSTLLLEPVYERHEKGWTTDRIRSYRAQITVTATTRDFARIGDILDAAGSAGATSVSTAFRRSNLSELKQQVRAMALAAAKAKAEQTAAALGVELGRVMSIAETPAGVMWHHTYFPANVMETRNTATPIALGGALQPLTLDVTIGYELAART